MFRSVSSNRFATVGSNGIIRFWNAETGQKIGETKPTGDMIRSLAFAGDGHSLFAAYLSGSVLQWKIPEGTQIGQAMKHSEKMDALAVSPSGNEVATGCRDDSLYLWKIGSESAPSHKIRHTNPVLAVTYSPDGRFIATGCDDHTARIWSVPSGEQQGEPFYLNGRPTVLRFTAGGNALLVAGTEDTDVDCYDTKTHNPLYLPLPQPTGVRHITTNTSGSLVITTTAVSPGSGVYQLLLLRRRSGYPNFSARSAVSPSPHNNDLSKYRLASGWSCKKNC